MLIKLAQTEGLKTVVDGANSDDKADYRPACRRLPRQGCAVHSSKPVLAKTRCAHWPES
jgi:PP-loop superfamily ATP-utilizing enzyme